MNKKFKNKLLIITSILVFIFLSMFVDEKTLNNLKNKIFNDEIKQAMENLPSSKEELNLKREDIIELTDDLMVFFMDVGQADSILIKSQDEYMLIDAGNNEDGEKLVNYFKSLGISKFKYVVGSHAHEDHIGGMDNIINNFDIEKFYMPDVLTTTETFYDVLDALETKKIKYNVPVIDSTLKLGNSTVEFIYVGDNKEDLNDSSIIVKLTYLNTSFLFTGDASSNSEKLILDKDLNSTVLKVGHHGSKYSSSAQFLVKVRPKYAVISCGKDNSYGHPHDVTINKLEKINAQVLRTDELGTIVAISDGENITFKNIETNTDGESNEK